MATIESHEVSRLASTLRGTVLEPGSGSYEDARRLYNAAIDRRPGLIACCEGAGDVAASIDFGREHGLVTSVRGGGHSIAGNAVCDGGLAIDLSPMKGIRVDAANRTVRAEGGVLVGELDRATQEFGLAVTMGNVSTTGIGGLTLGGGLGYIMRKYGLACDNLLSVDVVTADGRKLTASAAENPDLFWALRGGGGNFGVATSFEYRLHPVGPVLAGPIFHPLADARYVLRCYRELAATAPDELSCYALLSELPDGTRFAAMLPVWCGAINCGERELRPLRKFGTPFADQLAPMPYLALQSFDDPMFPAGLYHYWTSSFLQDLNDEAIEVIAEYAQKRPTPMCAVLLEPLGGAIARVDDADTAFPHRRARFGLGALGISADRAGHQACAGWARRLREAMRPFASGGAYVNYLSATDDPSGDVVRDAYGAETYARLAAVKAKYDPTNFFRMNQNVKPAEPR